MKLFTHFFLRLLKAKSWYLLQENIKFNNRRNVWQSFSDNSESIMENIEGRRSYREMPEKCGLKTIPHRWRVVAGVLLNIE